MGAILGIDLGTTNSCLAVFENGQARVLANAEGSRTTPSVVSFGPDTLVGEPALRFRLIHPEATVASAKRMIGRRHSEAGVEDPRSLPGPDDTVRLDLGVEVVSPEQVSARVLAKLVGDARSYLRQEIDGAVITVPAHFDDGQRQATLRAAELAGIEVFRLLNEPTAAALAYGRGKEDEVLAVFDLGGGTFDISILEIGEGVFEVLATAGDIDLGGDDFDRELVKLIGEAWTAEYREPLPEAAEIEARLAQAAREAKHELSGLHRTLVSLPFLQGSRGIELEITREEFEARCADLFYRLRAPLLEVLRDTETQPDELLFVGGMTRMPAVRRLAEEVVGIPARDDVQPDEAVALGAAVQAGSLRGEDPSLLLDVTPLSLGIEMEGRVMRRLIESNSTVPIRVSEVFTTAEDNQPAVQIRVLQGEHSLAEENRLLGEINLIGIPPSIAGLPQIEVCFDLDADGVLRVSARDLATGQEQALRLQGTAALSEEEIDQLRLLADELDEDLLARQERLAQARARRLDQVLGSLIGKVPDEMKKGLALALKNLRQKRSGEDLLQAVEAADHELGLILSSGLVRDLAASTSAKGPGPAVETSREGEDALGQDKSEFDSL